MFHSEPQLNQQKDRQTDRHIFGYERLHVVMGDSAFKAKRYTDTHTYKTYTLYIDHHVCCIDSLVPSPHLPHIENASQLSRAHLGEKNASQKL